MNSILNLSPSIRITLFIFMMISLAVLLYSFYYCLLLRRSKEFLFHCGSFFIVILFMAISRTPVIRIHHPDVINYVSLINLMPIGTSIYLFVKQKNVVHLIDTLWFIFNITLFEFIPYYGYFVSGLYIYALIRSFMILFKCIDYRKEYPGAMSIKYGLDELATGVAFANVFGQITYINGALKETLSKLSISSYNKMNEIIKSISIISKENGRVVNDNYYIINIEDKSYRFIFNDNHTQLTCMDISLEERLIQSEEKNQNELNIINKQLNEQLDKVDDIQKEKELLSIKGYVHDNFAQQLSILHMFLLNDQSKDLKELKQILLKIDEPINEGFKLQNDFDYLINILKQIDVELTIKGEFPKEDNIVNLFNKIIKEGTTNAIRHGYAKKIEVVVSSHSIEITNDGTIPSQIKYGNGLTSIEKEVNDLKGHIDISLDKEFKLVVEL